MDVTYHITPGTYFTSPENVVVLSFLDHHHLLYPCSVSQFFSSTDVGRTFWITRTAEASKSPAAK